MTAHYTAPSTAPTTARPIVSSDVTLLGHITQTTVTTVTDDYRYNMLNANILLLVLRSSEF